MLRLQLFTTTTDEIDLSFEARNLATQLYRFNSLPARNTWHLRYENQMVNDCATKQSVPTVRITANAEMQ
jgi:hypothetical protein